PPAVAVTRRCGSGSSTRRPRCPRRCARSRPTWSTSSRTCTGCSTPSSRATAGAAIPTPRSSHRPPRCCGRSPTSSSSGA
ncbi:MAG: Cold shock protein of CSP family _ SCO4325, partial [uncultured Nocardioidaceae bacterium]